MIAGLDELRITENNFYIVQIDKLCYNIQSKNVFNNILVVYKCDFFLY